jgi:hypothetical protein
VDHSTLCISKLHALDGGLGLGGRFRREWVQIGFKSFRVTKCTSHVGHRCHSSTGLQAAAGFGALDLGFSAFRVWVILTRHHSSHSYTG